MKRLITALTIPLFCVLTACQTMEGLGRDIEKGGDNLEQKAREERVK